ncbi:MAG: hypothetical protein R6X02_01905 [Enhygromyxa sp.]
MLPHSDLDPVSALMRILAERWVLTLALSDGDHAPYPAPLFYALAEPGALGDHEAPLLLFASSAASYHGRLTGAGPILAAAAVYLESETVGVLRGAQLRGLLVRDDALSEAGAAAARAAYVARHAPPTLPSGTHIYALIVTWAKLTDNRLGFGQHPEARFEPRWSALRSPARQPRADVEQSPT